MSEKSYTLAKDLRKATPSEFHCRCLTENEQMGVTLGIISKAEENNRIRKNLSES